MLVTCGGEGGGAADSPEKRISPKSVAEMIDERCREILKDVW